MLRQIEHRIVSLFVVEENRIGCYSNVYNYVYAKDCICIGKVLRTCHFVKILTVHRNRCNFDLRTYRYMIAEFVGAIDDQTYQPII